MGFLVCWGGLLDIYGMVTIRPNRFLSQWRQSDVSPVWRFDCSRVSNCFVVKRLPENITAGCNIPFTNV